jgi:hypothetical protein
MNPSDVPSPIPSPAAPAQRYQVQRITWGSALKVGLALGWALVIVPAMVIAWLVNVVIDRAFATVAQIQPMDINVLGQSLATIDPIQIVGQAENVQTLGSLSASGAAVFVLVTLVVTVLGALVVLLGVLLFVGGYNLLARAVGGFEVDLAPPKGA